MPNIQSPGDDNFVPTAMGVSSADGVSTIPLRVDPVTGRLEIEIVYGTNGAAPTLPVNTPRDENFVPVSRAVTDDTALTFTPFLINNSTGFLGIDLLQE